METIAAADRQRARPADRARSGLRPVPDLLFLTQRLPWPPNKGEKIRCWHILNHLRQSYHVHFGCLVDDPADRQHIETVRALCASLYAAPLHRRWARLTCA